MSSPTPPHVELTPYEAGMRRRTGRPVNEQIESHQYEEYENEVWKHQQSQYTFSTQTHWWSTLNKRQCRMWAQTLLIGFLTGLSAYFVIYFTGKLTAVKLALTYRLINEERKDEIPFGSAFGVYVCFNVAFASVAWFTVYVTPHAAGSGIPEVKCFLNGLSVPYLHMSTIASKLIGIVFTVASGLPAGKEGPMIHSGAGLGLAVSQSDSVFKCMGLTTSFRKFYDFHNDGEKRDYVTTGSAAGVAAAFVTTLFVIRTVNIHLGQAHANAMFSFGEFFRLNASVYNFSVWELPLFCLQGVMGGLIGAAFNGANKRLHEFRMRTYISNSTARWLEVVLVSLLMSCISFGIPTLFPHCTPKPHNMEDWTDQEKALADRLVPLYCDPSTEYSQTGSLFLTDSDTAIKQLFHFREIGDDAEPTFSSSSLILFFIPYLCVACLNYGAAVPSGLFVPSLLQGACFGRLVGHLLHAFDRSRGTFADSGTFALIGAAAGLGGMARMTISLVVILLEATGDIQYLVPLMLTVMLARWVGNSFNDGLYDIHIHLKKIPFLEENDSDVGLFDIGVTVGDIMTPAPICFPQFVPVYEVFDLLQRNRHHAFPVVGQVLGKGPSQGPEVLLGMVPRKVLCVLLQHRAFGFYERKPNSLTDAPMSPLVNWGALEREYPHYPDVDSIHLSTKDSTGWIDLRPYLDPGPFTLSEKSSVQRAYKIFRTLGLRHLIVTNCSNQVVGMVTRKELLPSHIKKFNRFHCDSLDNSETPLNKVEKPSNNITLDGLNI